MTFRDRVAQLLSGYAAAYLRHDAEACAATFTRDARIDTPYGPPALGRAAIAATHRQWFEEAERNKRLEVIEAEDDQNTGCCLIRWSAEIDDPASGAAMTLSGATLAVLRREEAEWRFHRMALVPDPP